MPNEVKGIGTEEAASPDLEVVIYPSAGVAQKKKTKSTGDTARICVLTHGADDFIKMYRRYNYEKLQSRTQNEGNISQQIPCVLYSSVWTETPLGELNVSGEAASSLSNQVYLRALKDDSRRQASGNYKENKMKRQEEKAEIHIEGKELTENIDHAEDCN